MSGRFRGAWRDLVHLIDLVYLVRLVDLALGTGFVNERTSSA